MRIIFMGTPDFAVPTLDALVDAGHRVVAAYTQPPRPAGRGKKARPSPVHARAEELGIAVRLPASLKDIAAQARFLELEAEVAVVAAYGLLLPRAVLAAPTHGCLNVHASLLPRWRGAAPIQRAIQAGDRTTGITIMQMETGLDTGPKLLSASTPIEDKTAGELHDELARMGARLMVEALGDLDALTPEPQEEREATHAPKIAKTEARLDFEAPALQLEREVRAFSPFPGSWFALDGERIKMLRARVVGVNGAPGTVLDDQLTIACGNAALRPLRLQRAGRPAMDAADFLRGKPVPVGTVLR
ncbi:methionyl-tRNA formyltransferase [Aurantiacibacter spongiae]|uniref:Methionyl-tRNA formyltransferase n=1 Tax=Aurantiacibacter spongiae TaxID=2488860 RepID=A0A3N5DC19_9SPHN|nr:methionyl-tRNA formyltransferase [Aurantiacibacter spongiae]RPF72328.1 methionyl-tRNA formyltransferase [Aurantiacibacter spongiae]